MRRQRSIDFRRLYGASPLHLVAHLLALALAAFGLAQVLSDGAIPELIALFLGLVIVHDLVLVPFYTGVDRLMRRMLVPPPSFRRVGIPMINHVRAPLLISALLLAIYSPLIFGLSDGYYFGLSGHHLDGYFASWLLVTAALFLGSGLIYAARVAVRRRRIS